MAITFAAMFQLFSSRIAESGSYDFLASSSVLISSSVKTGCSPPKHLIHRLLLPAFGWASGSGLFSGSSWYRRRFRSYKRNWKFLSKNWSFEQNLDIWLKSWILNQKFDFQPKFGFLTKSLIFNQNLDF